MSKAKSKKSKKSKKSTTSKKSKSHANMICDLRFPRPTDVVLEFAKAFTADTAEDGSKVPDINKGVMRRADYDAAVTAFNDAMVAGHTPPPIPYIYQPVIVGYAINNGMKFGLRGQAVKHPRKPRNWPNDFHDFKLGEHIASFRLNHVEDVRIFVDNPTDNILKVGSREYLVGTSEMPAIFLVNSARSGCFYHNIAVGKEISFAEFEA